MVPTTAPTTRPASPAELSVIFRDSLRPYLQAQKLLSEDKAEGVARLVREDSLLVDDKIPTPLELKPHCPEPLSNLVWSASRRGPRSARRCRT
jgi:hypothetical protein